jgi:hypothetical protein
MATMNWLVDLSDNEEKEFLLVDGVMRSPIWFVTQRVAKWFHVDGQDKLYFGDIIGYSQEDKFWTVAYDDGDYEEYDIVDLKNHLMLHKKHFRQDTVGFYLNL